MSDHENSTTLPDLTPVRLLRSIGRTPAGSVGTIVGTYAGSKAYEVEFVIGDATDGNYHTVETCEAGDVEPLNV